MAEVGIVLPHGVNTGPELAEHGAAAEQAGFDSVWVTERYFHEEAFSLLGYLAAATQRLRLGLGVTNPYTRNPALLAMAAATVDSLSGGRLMLGVRVGWLAEEYATARWCRAGWGSPTGTPARPSAMRWPSSAGCSRARR